MHPYKTAPDDLINEYKSDYSKGLSSEQALKNKSQYGENVIKVSDRDSVIKLFFEQLLDPIVVLLLITVVISAITGDYFESVLIISIVTFMALIGVYVENKSGNALEQLKSMVKVSILTIRNGNLAKIDTTELVVGDIILLSEGDKVPADCRLLEANDLRTNEMILTGESLPVEKSVKIIDGENLPLGEQKNILFNGSSVAQGQAKAIITNVGSKTELGKIADKLSQSEKKPTPLQVELERISKILLWGTLIVCTIIISLSLFRAPEITSKVIIDSLVQALALAIAFIPEGLAAVMTVTLAIGVKEMIKKNVIIKRMIAAEGLGSVSILATDKTGTITTGLMTVEKIWFYNKEIEKGQFKVTNNVEQKLIDVLRYCNNSKGATESALVKFLEDNDIEFQLEERLVEHRFSSDVKRMTVIMQDKLKETQTGYSKGAPEILIELCSSYYDYERDKEVKFTPQTKDKIKKHAEEYAKLGYRVIGIAVKESYLKNSYGDREKDERDLLFVGILGLIDPLRDEVPETVSNLKRAGIRPIMITGDHPEIAKTIALQAGIIMSRDERVISGYELEDYFQNNSKMTSEDLMECRVFARVNPDHKNMLIDLYNNYGVVTAMAGDGVNDAVAISKASVGIAVAGGSEIVKEAADVVVLGRYDALANAVEVGRVIVQRTRLFLHYILSGNISEVGVFLLALVFGYTSMPLTPISLLIINVLTDAAPAMAMAFEKGDKSLMQQPPRQKKEGIINKDIWISIFIQGILSSIFLFLVFVFLQHKGLVYAQTATFTAYIFQKLLRAFTARSFTRSVITYGIFSNGAVVISVGLSLLVWLVIVYVFPLQFGFVMIELKELFLIILGALVFPMIEEGLKFFRRVYKPSKFKLQMIK